jgi:hypothetical protein
MKKIRSVLLPATLLFFNACYSQTNEVKTVNERTALKMEAKTIGNCNQMVPAGWLSATNKEGSALDLWDQDKTMYAGWGIFAVNTRMAFFYDKELYNKDPQRSVLRVGSMIVANSFGENAKIVFTDEINEQFNGYQLRSVSAGNYKGVVLYKIFPGDGFNYTYIEAVRFAITRNDLWEQKGMLVAGVAASIACTTILMPSEAPSLPKRSELKSSSARSKKDDYGYNMQLGTEYCHNPRTGENFRVSSENWSTGPAGPGYYGMAGNERIRMAPGRSN